MVKLDLFLGEFVVVRVDLVDQLPIKLHQLLSLLPHQVSFVLVHLQVLLPFLAALALTQVCVYALAAVQLKHPVALFAAKATTLTAAHLAHVRAAPDVADLYSLDNIVLVDEQETIVAEFLLAGSCLVVAEALVDQLVPHLAHVATPQLQERD